MRLYTGVLLSYTLRFIYIWFYKESIRNFSDFISLSVQWVIIEDLHIPGI